MLRITGNGFVAIRVLAWRGLRVHDLVWLLYRYLISMGRVLCITEELT